MHVAPPPDAHAAAGGAGLAGLACVIALVAPLLVLALVIWLDGGRALRVCPICAARAARSVLAEEIDADQLSIRVQCGQCGVWRRTTGTEAELERYERMVRRDRRRLGTQALRLAARRLRRSQSDFLRALRREVVGADDFLARAAPTVQRRYPA
jgi:ribosomal protein S27AE